MAGVEDGSKVPEGEANNDSDEKEDGDDGSEDEGTDEEEMEKEVGKNDGRKDLTPELPDGDVEDRDGVQGNALGLYLSALIMPAELE